MDEIAGIYGRTVEALDATVQLGVASGNLIQVSFPAQPDPSAEPDHHLLDRIEAYVAGESEADFRDVEIALTVPTDQRAVLQTLRRIGYGETTDPEALARMTPGVDAEADEARETVRQALAGNPIPIVLPDHRVDGIEGATPPEIRRRLREIEGISQ